MEFFEEPHDHDEPPTARFAAARRAVGQRVGPPSRRLPTSYDPVDAAYSIALEPSASEESCSSSSTRWLLGVLLLAGVLSSSVLMACGFSMWSRAAWKHSFSLWGKASGSLPATVSGQTPPPSMGEASYPAFAPQSNLATAPPAPVQQASVLPARSLPLTASGQMSQPGVGQASYPAFAPQSNLATAPPAPMQQASVLPARSLPLTAREQTSQPSTGEVSYPAIAPPTIVPVPPSSAAGSPPEGGLAPGLPTPVPPTPALSTPAPPSSALPQGGAPAFFTGDDVEVSMGPEPPGAQAASIFSTGDEVSIEPEPQGVGGKVTLDVADADAFLGNSALRDELVKRVKISAAESVGISPDDVRVAIAQV